MTQKTTDTSAHELHPGLPFSALTGMLLAASLAPLGSTMIAVALPSIGHDTGVNISSLTSWLVLSYLITSIALQSIGGKLGDLIGHGHTLIMGLLLVATGAMLGLLASDAHLLALARVLMASGGACTVPATMAILRNQTPHEKRARVFGMMGACMGLAAAIGPLLGGELTESFGWRAVFGANLPVIGLSLFLVLKSHAMFTKARAKADRLPFDWRGSLLLSVGLTLLIVALRVPGGASWWLGGLGIALLMAFPFQERRVISPVVDFSLFKKGAFFGGGTIIALQNMAMYPLLFQLPVFFDKVRGVGARTTGHALLALTLAMMLSSIIGGRLTETIGARMQALMGSLLALAGLWWFRDFQSIQAPSEVIPGLLLIGAGIGFTTPPAQASSMSTVGHAHAGMAGGMISTLRYMGGVSGTAMLGIFLDQPSSPASHQHPVAMYAGTLIVAAMLSLLLPARLKAAAQKASAQVL
ncbi:MAG: MFS transporter [Alphaproteobacteria bacterium]|nr:MFS transporter [Alphaproteobacteria bacterium]